MNNTNFNQGDQTTTTSRLVADEFNRTHKNILRAIKNLECSKEFFDANFQLIEYRDEQNKSQPEYVITRDGFMFLGMGFTGKDAAKLKEDFVTRNFTIKPKQVFQLVIRKDERIVTTSRLVAEKFNRRHADVLKSIENLECSKDFTERNFSLSEYTDSTGRNLPEYIITRDGFSFLVMGFTGKDAAKFKEEFIGAFNKMETELKSQAAPKTLNETFLYSLEALVHHQKQLIEQQNQLMEVKQVVYETNTRIVEHEERLKAVEAKETDHLDYYAISGYAALEKVKVDPNTAIKLGRLATSISEKRGLKVGKTAHYRFGEVGTYHISVLRDVFDTYKGLTDECYYYVAAHTSAVDFKHCRSLFLFF